MIASRAAPGQEALNCLGAALQVLIELWQGPNSALALLTTAALARGLAWRSPAPRAVTELSSPGALEEFTARLAPLVRVRTSGV